MVSGYQIENKCIVVDFDGTLIRGNSLSITTFFLCKKLFYNQKWGSLLSLIGVIFKRKLKFISHSCMKYHIIRLCKENFSSLDLKELGKILFHKVDSFVYNLLLNFSKRGINIILATAADDFYLPFVLNNFTNLSIQYIGTSYVSKLSNYKENKNEEKLKTLEKYLHKNHMQCISIISDHIDDLPLYKRFQGQNYLINPSSSTLRKMKLNLPDCSFIKLNDNNYSIKKCQP